MKLRYSAACPQVVDTALPELGVVTASAIVSLNGSPHMILVGESKKHKGPVIMGGKVEVCDGVPGVELRDAAYSCIVRELDEEIGIKAKNPKFLFQITDPNLDIRVVPFQKLQGCLGIEAGKYAPEQEIRAHYGVPDFIFHVEVRPDEFQKSEELDNLRFIDVRTDAIYSMGAGHAVVAKRYRDILLSSHSATKHTVLSDLGKLRGVSRLE
jgi:8-oxo-dGTP pyrophosphatase MutT (NUDIX family)